MLVATGRGRGGACAPVPNLLVFSFVVENGRTGQSFARIQPHCYLPCLRYPLRKPRAKMAFQDGGIASGRSPSRLAKETWTYANAAVIKIDCAAAAVPRSFPPRPLRHMASHRACAVWLDPSRTLPSAPERQSEAEMCTYFFFFISFISFIISISCTP